MEGYFEYLTLSYPSQSLESLFLHIPSLAKLRELQDIPGYQKTNRDPEFLM